MISFPLLLALAVVAAEAASLQRRAAPADGVILFDHPTSRGYSADTGNDAPCGGRPVNGSSPYPTSIGDIALTFQRDVSNFQLSYAPTNQSDDADAFKELLPGNMYLYPGQSCENSPDWTELGFGVGDEVTIQAKAESGPKEKTFYVCADIKLESYHTYASHQPEYECLNKVARVNINGKGDQSGDSVQKGYSFSPVGAGFIGAGVTIALVLLAALGLFFLFGLRLARRNKNIQTPSDESTHDGDDSSSANSMRKA